MKLSFDRVKRQSRTRHFTVWSVSAFVATLLLAGCTGTRTDGERRARQDQEAVERIFRPGGERPMLPKLDANTPLRDFLLFAMLNQPQVEATYYDWVAAVRRITVERSLPDPRFSFESDIADMVLSLMPGLMMDFPGIGKLKAAADIATAESEAKYFVFESKVLQTAFAVKKVCHQLRFLEDKIGVTRQTLQLLDELEQLALIQSEVGKATLRDVLLTRIEREQLAAELANLEDSRQPLLAQFQAALGLRAEDPPQTAPKTLEPTPPGLTAEMLLATALARNPQLRAMEAEVRLAQATLQLALRAKLPDFNAGIEVDVKASPQMFRPSFGVTLPLWRDKIAAQISAAQAGTRAAEARLSAEQIKLAVEFSEKSFMFREASRNLALLREKLLSMAQQSLEIARSGYVGGKVEFLNVIDAERTLLDFQVAAVEANLQRELSVAELSLVVLGVAPVDAPVLSPASVPRKTK